MTNDEMLQKLKEIRFLCMEHWSGNVNWREHGGQTYVGQIDSIAQEMQGELELVVRPEGMRLGEPMSQASPPGVERLYKAVLPFVRLLKGTSGRIPVERLSAANWHELAKAHEEATPPSQRGPQPRDPSEGK